MVGPLERRAKHHLAHWRRREHRLQLLLRAVLEERVVAPQPRVLLGGGAAAAAARRAAAPRRRRRLLLLLEGAARRHARERARRRRRAHRPRHPGEVDRALLDLHRHRHPRLKRERVTGTAAIARRHLVLVDRPREAVLQHHVDADRAAGLGGVVDPRHLRRLERALDLVLRLAHEQLELGLGGEGHPLAAQVGERARELRADVDEGLQP